MFSLFTFINFLYVAFRSHSLVALFENCVFCKCILRFSPFMEAGRPATSFMAELLLTALFPADTQHREA